MAYLEEMEEKEEKVEEMPEEGGSEEMEMEEVEEEKVSDPSSLKEGVARLIENWNPETPEGERYLDELKEVMAGAGGEEMGEMEEGMEEDDKAPGPSMGFDIVAMRKRAAKNAFPEM